MIVPYAVWTLCVSVAYFAVWCIDHAAAVAPAMIVGFGVAIVAAEGVRVARHGVTHRPHRRRRA